jgi:hypothetical protein
MEKMQTIMGGHRSFMCPEPTNYLVIAALLSSRFLYSECEPRTGTLYLCATNCCRVSLSSRPEMASQEQAPALHLRCIDSRAARFVILIKTVNYYVPRGRGTGLIASLNIENVLPRRRTRPRPPRTDALNRRRYTPVD